ncbi:hypothetical protein G6F42_010862 [Rhizopus arrhizus]|nr:hypothetical protein G6F42_010862 [Rhizopus arrhizus]
MLSTDATTTVNRDLNGAKNIALIEVSSFMSQDDFPLPHFRWNQNTNKYILSPRFLSHQPHDKERIPTQSGYSLNSFKEREA